MAHRTIVHRALRDMEMHSTAYRLQSVSTPTEWRNSTCGRRQRRSGYSCKAGSQRCHRVCTRTSCKSRWGSRTAGNSRIRLGRDRPTGRRGTWKTGSTERGDPDRACRSRLSRVTSTSPCRPFASPRIRLAAPAVAAPVGASVVGEGFFDAEIPPSFRLTRRILGPQYPRSSRRVLPRSCTPTGTASRRQGIFLVPTAWRTCSTASR